MGKVYAFNGYLFSQKQTGVMRFAKEILIGIDKICKHKEFCLVVPEYADNLPELEKISIVKYGNTKGNLWEQKDFFDYIRKNKLYSVNFNNTMPLAKPGIIVIHDISYKIHPEFGDSLHGKLSNIYHRIIFQKAAKSNIPIVTVSYFSKLQLIDEYKIDPSRITVIGNAWQHFESVGIDDSTLEKHNLSKKEYYLSLGSLSKMKNTKWFLEAAKKNPEKIFVLAGTKPQNSKKIYDSAKTVILVGYISDAQIKSLIRNCKAFIYPSIYDGFGIPPMEALSQGATVICGPGAGRQFLRRAAAAFELCAHHPPQARRHDPGRGHRQH